MSTADRPQIPAELRRRVLVEAGHCCAMPTCGHPNVDIHHIVPWKRCRQHEYENLIALCPNCHRRADSGEIDRKSLRAYKANAQAAHARLSQAPIDSLEEGITETEPKLYLNPRSGNWPVYTDGNHTPYGRFNMELEFGLTVLGSNLELLAVNSVFSTRTGTCLHREPFLKLGDETTAFLSDWFHLASPPRLYVDRTVNVFYRRQLRPPKPNDLPIDIETGWVSLLFEYRPLGLWNSLSLSFRFHFDRGRLVAQREV